MKTNRRTAFTLIELLTVIAIIGILAGILIPVVGTVRAKADASVCIGRMRQTGVAIAAYMVDFRDRLPGPFAGYRAVPWYAKGGIAEMQTMAALLHPYVSSPEPTQSGKRIFPEVFQCPAVNKRPDPSKTISDNREIITRLINMEVRLDGDSNPATSPWGDRNLTPVTDPITYAQLGGSVSLTRTWALRECALGYANGNLGTAAGHAYNRHLPHGKHFNILWFDWHVSRLDTEQFKD
ncbi:prepilin-type N-terminal cleavage/methylation domain-containing protein [Opitutaceae bacterium TAV4]|nr:prepilin-type N-terminal cleavage/methylation domain-containing protein [Opitutaceae bacterium TAV4]RRK01769.1 prepilin-type N-terminal cleavage/methylation domain-containing protein [Opitutaceae bacterium TAV3]